MEDKVYLSVVMAEYNTKETELRESINSILNQTYQFFELIIVDDCGKNNVENIVKSFEDNRIKVIKNEKNKCQNSWSRNKGKYRKRYIL